MTWQFYPSLQLLPWHHKQRDEEFGLTNHFAGWLCWQFRWRS